MCAPAAIVPRIATVKISVAAISGLVKFDFKAIWIIVLLGERGGAYDEALSRRILMRRFWGTSAVTLSGVLDSSQFTRELFMTMEEIHAMYNHLGVNITCAGCEGCLEAAHSQNRIVWQEEKVFCTFQLLPLKMSNCSQIHLPISWWITVLYVFLTLKKHSPTFKNDVILIVICRWKTWENYMKAEIEIKKM